jgi:hypothetical protein
VTLPPRDERHARAALVFFIAGLLASPVGDRNAQTRSSAGPDARARTEAWYPPGVRRLLLIACFLVACSDDETGAGGGDPTTSASTGTPDPGTPSLQATFTCGGMQRQLSCPNPSVVFKGVIDATGAVDMDCPGTEGERVTIIVPSPVTGDLRQQGVKYFVAITCPGGSEVKSLSEAGGGSVTISEITGNVSVAGSFTSDAGDASGTFKAVAP